MTLRKMSGHGDEVVAEWTETTSPERIAEIEKEFNDLTAKGFWAADVTPGREPSIIHKFDEKSDILLGPHLQGGSA